MKSRAFERHDWERPGTDAVSTLGLRGGCWQVAGRYRGEDETYGNARFKVHLRWPPTIIEWARADSLS